MFTRSYGRILKDRLGEERRFIQVVSGPRQVGKTTLVQQMAGEVQQPVLIANADVPQLKDRDWLVEQWLSARESAGQAGAAGSILVLDEIQKIPGWSEVVKWLWDGDTLTGIQLRVVLLGSAPLLLQYGLTESLAGRFEVIRLPHWSFGEMREAFGFSLEQYIFYGGYPGAAPLISDPTRWQSYILDSLVETTISRDVLLLSRVEKPALLRRLFDLGCRYSGQVLSYNKMLGQLQDAGNTTTLAHYLDLLSKAGLIVGLQKYAADFSRQRGSSPKLQVLNTALMGALNRFTFDDARQTPEYWGRLIESAVGAYLANLAAQGRCDLFYWRDKNREVDYVLRIGRKLVAVEVKSGRTRSGRPGLAAFAELWKPERTLLVGDDGIPLQEFLLSPLEHWVSE